ncbi:GAF domain-containing protein [Caulobacter segnis]
MPRACRSIAGAWRPTIRCFGAGACGTAQCGAQAREGTNGIGTCLTEQRVLTIHRDQHFHTRNIGLSCTVAPLFEPPDAWPAPSMSPHAVRAWKG